MKQSTIIMAVVAILVIGVGVFAFMNMQNKPSDNKMTPPVAVESEKKAMNKTIVDIASENSDFSTLVAAVKAAGLVETLSGEGPFTVFAPTNEAFAKLPAGTVEALLKDKEKLTKILTYHVVAGKVMAKDVVGLTSAKTVEGSDLTVKVDNGKVMINNANVTTTDIEASNGVIHVIDTVLMPQ
jgi:uncharacterized surface protein with fasciclin (FAS1) repeats